MLLMDNGAEAMCVHSTMYTLACISTLHVHSYTPVQYPSSTRPIIKMLAIAMASYERWYEADKDNPLRQLLQSLWKGNKYLQNPTQMGLKLDELTLISSVYFVKAFWSIMEQDAVKVWTLCMSLHVHAGWSDSVCVCVTQAAMNLISHSVEISHSLEVPAKNIVLTVSVHNSH